MTVSLASKKSVRSLRPAPGRNAPARPSKPREFPITAEQYLKMGDLGFFQDRRVELIEGRIIEMAPMNEGHWRAVLDMPDVLRKALGATFRIGTQIPLAIDELSEPEPDFIVMVAGSEKRGITKSTALLSTVLVIEISDATPAYDRKIKAGLYAKANIAEYWILNLKARELEVLREPVNGAYTTKLVFSETDAVTPLAVPKAEIAVKDMLP